MAKANQTEILAKFIELLTPLSSEERQRMVRASLTFLGEQSPDERKSSEVKTDEGGDDDLNLPVRARAWFKQSGLTSEQLQQVFHFADGKVDVIASDIPGSSTKVKTVNAYVLAGLAKYLASGDLKFDDKSARSVCSTSGCYDNTNHATYLKSKGNLFTGSKEGWAMTTPGLKHAAELVKALTKSEK
jgi:hypothetical protein